MRTDAMTSAAVREAGATRPCWYVARTSPLQEYAVRDQLLAHGVEVFLPCVPAERVRRGHDDTPLFPSYIFVRFGAADGAVWLLRQWLPSVRLVTFDSAAPPVPDDVMSALVALTARAAAEGGVWRRFRPADQVTVWLGGSEILGEVLEENPLPQSSVRVLIRLLGRLVDVKISPKKVRPASMATPSRRTRGRGRWIRGFGDPSSTFSRW